MIYIDNIKVPEAILNTVTGGTCNLQSKAIEINENTTSVILPDEGYDGMQNVDITVNVPTPQPVLEELSVTSNGSYTPSTGVDGYSKVTVNVPSGGGGNDEPFKFSEIKYTGNEEPIKAGLAYAKQIYDNWDATQTDLSNNFNSNTNLIFMPAVDTSQATNMSSFFNYCTNLITVPILNTSNCTDMSHFYGYCASLRNLPVLDTSNCENMSSMYDNIGSIGTIPEMDTSKCRYFDYFCSYNYGLTTVPVIDLSSAKNISNMFQGCSQLNLIKFKGNPVNITNLTDAFGGGEWNKLKENGTLFYDPAYDYSAIIAELKRTNPTWVAKPAFTPEVCTSLQITADNSYKDDTTTIIHYTAICNGINDYTGQSIEGVEIKGDVRSEKFEQNNTGAPKQVTITYNYLNQTATTEITQSTELNPDVLEFEFTGDTITYSINNNTYTATTSPVVIKPSVQYPDMYQISFYDSQNLTKFNRFRGYSSQLTDMYERFMLCRNLTSVNISLTSIQNTYNMFHTCTSLKEIVLEGDPSSIQDSGNMFGQDPYSIMAKNGVLTYDSRYNYDAIINELKTWNHTWTVKSSFVPETCSALNITADDVEGDATTTTIHYTATVSGYDSITGERKENVEITGDVQSEDFGENPSTTESRQVTISYTLLNQTTTTTITQAAAPTVVYDVTFNTQEDVNKWKNEGTYVAADGQTYNIADVYFITPSDQINYVEYMMNTFVDDMANIPGYFVSEKMNLEYNNYIEFTIGNSGGDWRMNNAVSIREVNGQWEDIYSIPADGNQALVKNSVVIPEQYNNKQVEIAFKIQESMGGWVGASIYIRSVKVKSLAV